MSTHLNLLLRFACITKNTVHTLDNARKTFEDHICSLELLSLSPVSELLQETWMHSIETFPSKSVSLITKTPRTKNK